MNQVIFKKKLSKFILQPNDFIIIDQRLLQISAVKKWMGKQTHYSVKAGESLKDLNKFPAHVGQIIKRTQKISSTQLRFIVVGGGSIGDFGGFVASIFKRGVPLVHIPSTWLAAIDSSHGGKTALNVDKYKNQIGTFYPAEKTYIFQDLLFHQPKQLALDAFGEMIKTFLLSEKLARTHFLKSKLNADTLWRHLKTAITYKYEIVEADPFEKEGIRSLLNLGHSLGHAFELKLKWSHGKAIFYGCVFDLMWSAEKGFISDSDLASIVNSPVWQELFNFKDYKRCLSINKNELKTLLLQDKKRTSASQLRQIFIKTAGQPILALVTFEEILKEYERQKKYFN